MDSKTEALTAEILQGNISVEKVREAFANMPDYFFNLMKSVNLARQGLAKVLGLPPDSLVSFTDVSAKAALLITDLQAKLGGHSLHLPPPDAATADLRQCEKTLLGALGADQEHKTVADLAKVACDALETQAAKLRELHKEIGALRKKYEDVQNISQAHKQLWESLSQDVRECLQPYCSVGNSHALPPAAIVRDIAERLQFMEADLNRLRADAALHSRTAAEADSLRLQVKTHDDAAHKAADIARRYHGTEAVVDENEVRQSLARIENTVSRAGARAKLGADILNGALTEIIILSEMLDPKHAEDAGQIVDPGRTD